MADRQRITPQVMIRSVQDGDLEAFFAHQQDQQARYLAAFVSVDPSNREAFDRHWQRIRSEARTTVRTVLVDAQVAGHVGGWTS